MYAVCGSGMEKKQVVAYPDEMWAVTAVTGAKFDGTETEEEENAAIERWASLPEEEQRRLMIEYGEKRRRQERFGEIP